MESTEKAIDGFGVVDQAKAESVLLISGWMGDNLLKKTGTRRGGRAKKSLCGCFWGSITHTKSCASVTCLADGWNRAL